MIAADVPLVLLAIGLVVLCATTTATILGLAPNWRRSARNAEALAPTPVAAAPRRVITGRPLELPFDVGALDTLPRSPVVRQGGPATTADEAEAALVRALEEHPDVVARVLADWITRDTSGGAGR